MEISTKFNLGQEVYTIAGRIAHCEICQRTGTVTIGSESFTCPKCEGKSKHPQWIVIVIMFRENQSLEKLM